MTRLLSPDAIRRFTEMAGAPAPDLAPAALAIARLEFPRLDAAPYLRTLDEMGAAAAERVAGVGVKGGAKSSAKGGAKSGPGADFARRVAGLNAYLFEDQGFAGNRAHYDDPRNSFLNTVLDRRVGIPITLALVYIEVARRAGVPVAGVNFPGHFLLRAQPSGDDGGEDREPLILDPFHGGAILSENDCRRLLHARAGPDRTFDRRLLARATKSEILVRMLVNLKRIYVGLRSFPQAHAVTELLLALAPSALTELRDRGLLAYQLHDYPSALRDLEAYLRLASPRGGAGSGGGGSEREDKKDGGGDERSEIWEHVKALRRRVAGLN